MSFIINRIRGYFAPSRVAELRLGRFVQQDQLRSSGCFSWTPSELRRMAQAEKLARVCRKAAPA